MLQSLTWGYGVNATVNNISVILVEETGMPQSHQQTRPLEEKETLNYINRRKVLNLK